MPEAVRRESYPFVGGELGKVFKSLSSFSVLRLWIEHTDQSVSGDCPVYPLRQSGEGGGLVRDVLVASRGWLYRDRKGRDEVCALRADQDRCCCSGVAALTE